MLESFLQLNSDARLVHKLLANFVLLNTDFAENISAFYLIYFHLEWQA